MNKRFSTKSVHGGEDRHKAYDSITTPITQTSTFVFSHTDDIKKYTSKELIRFEYGRYGNPTQRAAEKKLAELENAEDALLFSSGMSAITTTFLALMSIGDHLLLTDDAYKKTLDFCQTCLPRFGIESTIVKMGDYDAIEGAIRENTKIFFSESPTNPYLNIMDLERIFDIGKRHGLIIISDSTFATPYNQQPLDYGIDIVIHSATKYLGGHNDLLAGVVLGGEELIEKIREFSKMMGGVIDPHGSYLLIRGLKTFVIRMERLNESGLKVARFLEKHPRIERVYYPGLKSHAHYDIAKRQMRGFGSVVTFIIKGNAETATRFLNNLKLCYIGPSFGGVETLITHLASMSYYDYPLEERLELGILDTLMRLSVGIEDSDDVIDDLNQALDACMDD